MSESMMKPVKSRAGDYPEQRHAGAIGLGPEYGKSKMAPTIGDKVGGYREELTGKMIRKPEKVQHGRERRSGELKKKQMEEEQDPFHSGE